MTLHRATTDADGVHQDWFSLDGDRWVSISRRAEEADMADLEHIWDSLYLSADTRYLRHYGAQFEARAPEAQKETK